MGDKLAKIEKRSKAPWMMVMHPEDVRALVEVAKAARPFGEMAQEMLTGHPTGRLPKGAPERLLTALSRLNV